MATAAATTSGDTITSSPMTMAETRAAATHIHHLVFHYRDASLASSPNHGSNIGSNHTMNSGFDRYQQQQIPLQAATVARVRKKMHRRSGSFGQMYGGAAHNQRGRMHHRENSAGLDILSAAADGMNQEELAAIAASNTTAKKNFISRDLSTSTTSTNNDGQQHSRECSFTAFGSLGSWDLKRLMNSLSPQPPSTAESSFAIRPTTHNSSMFSAASATPTTAFPSSSSNHEHHHPIYQQDEQQHHHRSDTPPTPMSSNLDRRKSGSNMTHPSGSNTAHPLLPNLTSSSSINNNGNSSGTGMPSYYLKRHHHHPNNSLYFYPPDEMMVMGPPPAQQQQHGGVSTSASLNTMATPQQPHHVYLRAQQHPHHSREPSEPAKLLMKLEQTIEQQQPKSMEQQTPSIINSYQQQHPVYEFEPSDHGEVLAPRLVVGQMVFASCSSVVPAPLEYQQQQEQHPHQQFQHPHQQFQHPHQQKQHPHQQHPHQQPLVVTTPTTTPLPIYPISYSTPASSLSSNKKRKAPPSNAVTLTSPTIQQQQPPSGVWSSATASACNMSVNSCDTRGSGNNKRVRRKCSMPNCDNRVVQGGLCISHGAKRKQCSHLGCPKNVKKAGLCSSHGPSRKKCEFGNCNKVAVQGGKCITHGAKKKMCVHTGCEKQGIIIGYCKKHHDQVTAGTISACDDTVTTAATMSEYPLAATTSAIIDNTRNGPPLPPPPPHGGGQHTRGLSIFHDMQAMEQFIVCDEAINAANGNNALNNNVVPRRRGEEIIDPSVPQQQEQQLHKRGLSLFGDENVSDAIISGVLISGGP